MRTFLLTIHILAAAAWLGGAMMLIASFPKFAELAGFDKVRAVDEAVGAKFFGSAAGLLVLSGIGLVLRSEVIGWTTTFVLVGIAVIIIDGILEQLVITPSLKRAAATEDPRTFRRAVWRGGGLHVVMLTIALWAMVAKLGL